MATALIHMDPVQEAATRAAGETPREIILAGSMRYGGFVPGRSGGEGAGFARPGQIMPRKNLDEAVAYVDRVLRPYGNRK